MAIAGESFFWLGVIRVIICFYLGDTGRILAAWRRK